VAASLNLVRFRIAASSGPRIAEATMASLRPPGKTYDRESVEESLDALRARRTFPEAGADVIVLRDAPATPRHRSRTQPGTTMQPDQFRCRPEAGVHRARLSNGFRTAIPKRLRKALMNNEQKIQCWPGFNPWGHCHLGGGRGEVSRGTLEGGLGSFRGTRTPGTRAHVHHFPARWAASNR